MDFKKLIQSDGSCVIPKRKSIPDNAFFGCKELKTVVIPAGVERIGREAFMNCLNLKSVTIPDGVKAIEERAFDNCFELTGIELPSTVNHIGNEVFRGCKKLERIKLPELVKTIPIEAFVSCAGLKSIELPEGLEEIQAMAFYNCTSLRELNIPEKVQFLDETAFIGCAGLEKMTVHSGNLEYCSEENAILSKDKEILLFGCQNSRIPNGVKEIAEYAFEGISTLKSIEIPSSVYDIIFNSFKGCTGLEKITVDKENQIYRSENNCLLDMYGELIAGCKTSIIPQGVKMIGSEAFYGIKGLTEIVIPDSVEEISYEAFWGTGIKKIDIPSSVKSIFSDAFSGCEQLNAITVSENNPNYSSSGNCLLSKDGKKLIQGCLSSIIPDTVEEIDWHAFSFYKELSHIFIPASVKKIDVCDFWMCSNLSSIEVDPKNPYFCSDGNCLLTADRKHLIRGCKTSIIPEGVTTINPGAFYECDSLENIILPDSVTDIGNKAFAGCTNLSSITLPEDVNIEVEAFADCYKLLGHPELKEFDCSLWLG